MDRAVVACNRFGLGAKEKELELAQAGQVLGEWPGLKENQLYQGRDLKPTSNTFDWISQHLAYHWDTNVNTLNRAVRGV